MIRILILIFLIKGSSVFAQKDTTVFEQKEIRFKSKRIQDLVSDNITTFKKTFKFDPKIVILDFYESRENEESENYPNSNQFKIRVETCYNSFYQFDYELYKNHFTGMTVYENVIVLLANYNVTKFANQPFFFVDEKKIKKKLIIEGDMTSLTRNYILSDKGLKEIGKPSYLGE